MIYTSAFRGGEIIWDNRKKIPKLPGRTKDEANRIRPQRRTTRDDKAKLIREATNSTKEAECAEAWLGGREKRKKCEKANTTRDLK